MLAKLKQAKQQSLRMDEKADKKPAQKTFTLIDPRDHFIGVALAEIIKSQLAEGRWHHDVAASHAVRYADATMREREHVQGPFAAGAQGQVFVPQVVVPPAPPVQQTETPVPVPQPVPAPAPAAAVKSLQDQLTAVNAPPVAEAR